VPHSVILITLTVYASTWITLAWREQSGWTLVLTQMPILTIAIEVSIVTVTNHNHTGTEVNSYTL